MKTVCEREQDHKKVIQRIKEDVMLSSDVERIAKIFRVLADSSRLKIVIALLKGEMCVYHLTEICNSTQSAVSHQLRILRDNHIVKARRLGQTVEYSIADAHIREIIEIGKAHLLCDLGE